MRNRRDRFFILFHLTVDQFSWRGVAWFLGVYFGAFLVAGIFGPLLYHAIQAIPADPSGEGMIAYLQRHPLGRYVDRVRLLTTAVALVWLITACGLWGRFGFSWSKGGSRLFNGFFLLGLGTLGLVMAAQTLFLGIEPAMPFSLFNVAGLLIEVMVGALLIGFLEEAIFRGMLFRMVYTALRPHLAILLSSLVFASVHFKEVMHPPAEPLAWWAGLWVAAQQSVSVFFNAQPTYFLNLFLVGIVLCLVFLRTRSLVACMGLHAGWVFARGLWSQTVEVGGGTGSHFWGSEGVVDGTAALLMLGSLAVALYVSWQQTQQKSTVSLERVT
jgi:membrane protease YdiL (CAAX protease family)